MAEFALSGVQRAAVVLLSLGEQQAAEVLKHMGAKEVQKLGVAMTSVGNVSREEVEKVIDEFVTALERPSLGSGAEEQARLHGGDGHQGTGGNAKEEEGRTTHYPRTF